MRQVSLCRPLYVYTECIVDNVANIISVFFNKYRDTKNKIFKIINYAAHFNMLYCLWIQLYPESERVEPPSLFISASLAFGKNVSPSLEYLRKNLTISRNH